MILTYIKAAENEGYSDGYDEYCKIILYIGNNKNKKDNFHYCNEDDGLHFIILSHIDCNCYEKKQYIIDITTTLIHKDTFVIAVDE